MNDHDKRWVVFDEFQVTILTPAKLSHDLSEQVKRMVDDPTLANSIRKATRSFVAENGISRSVRIRVSR